MIITQIYHTFIFEIGYLSVFFFKWIFHLLGFLFFTFDFNIFFFIFWSTICCEWLHLYTGCRYRLPVPIPQVILSSCLLSFLLYIESTWMCNTYISRQLITCYANQIGKYTIIVWFVVIIKLNRDKIPTIKLSEREWQRSGTIKAERKKEMLTAEKLRNKVFYE